ncbi:hypothetical protein GLYMA_13G291350v4 [Glycine max]|nr:hypothetical protein GLYMA_13G291350v4 [Glycine max]KAH1103947.1 hypothetical protein GYH30_037726 [Glycine max]
MSRISTMHNFNTVIPNQGNYSCYIWLLSKYKSSEGFQIQQNDTSEKKQSMLQDIP